MTWDNYGKWHVDHIIPKSKFKFKSIDDAGLKECWKLENLQPLWAEDNLSEGYNQKCEQKLQREREREYIFLSEIKIYGREKNGEKLLAFPHQNLDKSWSF